MSISNSCYFGDQALKCLVDQYIGAFGGEGLLGLMAGSLLFIVFYIASDGNVAVPTVVVILTGGLTIPMLPAQYAAISSGLVVIGLASALWQVLQKYVLNPSTV